MKTHQQITLHFYWTVLIYCVVTNIRQKNYKWKSIQISVSRWQNDWNCRECKTSTASASLETNFWPCFLNKDINFYHGRNICEHQPAGKWNNQKWSQFTRRPNLRYVSEPSWKMHKQAPVLSATKVVNCKIHQWYWPIINWLINGL